MKNVTIPENDGASICAIPQDHQILVELETLAKKLTEHWCSLNDFSLDCTYASQFEADITAVIAKGIEAGDIKLSAIPRLALRPGLPAIDWRELRDWVMKEMGEDWQKTPFWHGN